MNEELATLQNILFFWRELEMFYTMEGFIEIDSNMMAIFFV